MCGHVGFINKIEDSQIVLKNMMNKIIHRGPDSSGTYIDEDIALGFRRLSIIDIEQGAQPLFNEDRSIVLVFNGEIYNFLELKAELIAKGHIFKTDSDSEVLIHGYEEYKENLLIKLRGMFSFIIWDKNENQIFGARDFFGIKPMYYSSMGSTFMFGSEIKSFLAHPEFKKELNEVALENYLTFQYSPTEETFFKNVYKLPPAHYFIYKDSKLSIKKYWEINFDSDESKSLDYWIDQISEKFEDSVEAHKLSDVEVGSFLSSGIDSSYVACIADVDKTFTVGFNSEQYNEISFAKSLSDHLNIKNISKIISAKEYWDVLPNIQYLMDEPLADPAAVALYFVCNIASDHVKVVLSGEGADEIFGGYSIYKEPLDMKFYDKIPLSIRKFIGKIACKFPSIRGLNFLIRRSKSLEDRFIGNAYMFNESERKNLLKISTDAPNANEITGYFYNKVKSKDSVTKMQYLDLHLWLTGDILLKADKMSMANSLELRVPFLDKNIMELAAKIPLKYRVNDINTKYALRMASAKKLPKATAEKKKLGFPVPIRVWLKEETFYNIVKEAFESDISKKYFNTEILIELLDSHKASKVDNSRKIWTVFMFILWYREYFINR